VLAQVNESCVRHARDAESVDVIAVTKGFPASDVIALAGIGVSDFGESRDQEAREKRAAVESAGVKSRRWHAIGQVQTNKAKNVAAWADLVHSVDRLRLVHALEAAVPVDHRLDVLIQVRTDVDGAIGEPGRAGISLGEWRGLADAVLASAHLRLRGVMTVAYPAGPARPQFERIAHVWAELKSMEPDATIFSAGMSGDFDAAISAGATHLRIGTAILGTRG
jgi:hypothetical protein